MVDLCEACALTDKQNQWQSSAAKSTAVDYHPPHPPDLARYDFSLFPKMKLQPLIISSCFQE